ASTNCIRKSPSRGSFWLQLEAENAPSPEPCQQGVLPSCPRSCPPITKVFGRRRNRQAVYRQTIEPPSQIGIIKERKINVASRRFDALVRIEPSLSQRPAHEKASRRLQSRCRSARARTGAGRRFHADDQGPRLQPVRAEGRG